MRLKLSSDLQNRWRRRTWWLVIEYFDCGRVKITMIIDECTFKAACRLAFLVLKITRLWPKGIRNQNWHDDCRSLCVKLKYATCSLNCNLKFTGEQYYLFPDRFHRSSELVNSENFGYLLTLQLPVATAIIYEFILPHVENTKWK